MITAVSFVRRVNPDSTIDSICLSCFRTVATAQQESDLVEKENGHTCRPLEIENVRSLDSQRGTS